jgi:putative membrane protein
MVSTNRVVKGLAAGLIGGLAASWVMNRFQAMLSKALEGREKPHGAQSIQEGSPNHGAGAELQKRGKDKPDDNAAERTVNLIAETVFDQELAKDEKKTAGEAVHYAFGGITGAVYGAMSELWPEAAVGAGLPFGAAVWLAADEIAMPALGLSKPATEYPLSKHAYALASHLVYGVTTEVVRQAVRKALLKEPPRMRSWVSWLPL